IHRLWHRRTGRDELLLLLLALLLLCAGAALSAELTFGLAFLGFAVSGTWALALTHLRSAIEEGRGPAGSAALLNSRRVATPALHWRARSLSQWTGHGWRSPDGGLIPVMRLPRRPRGGGVPSVLSTDIEVVGQFTDGVVFTPEGWPLGVDFRRPGSPRQLYRNVEGDLFYQPVDGGDVRYTVAADLDEPAPGGLRGRGQRYPS